MVDVLLLLLLLVVGGVIFLQEKKLEKSPTWSGFSEICHKIKVVGRGRFSGVRDLRHDLGGHGGRLEVEIA